MNTNTEETKKKVTYPSSMEELISLINKGEIRSIGAVKGYFADVPEQRFDKVGFSMFKEQPNARVIDDVLYLDLWFRPERTTEKGVLQEKINDYNERLVQQTIAIEQIDYVSRGYARHYWS